MISRICVLKQDIRTAAKICQRSRIIGVLYQDGRTLGGQKGQMDLFEYVGNKIRELRVKYAGGKGLSQEALGREMKVTANTISRWETATYQPSLQDLDHLGRFFGVSVLDFFPREQPDADEKISALLRTAKQLPEADLEELRRFAEFRRAQAIYKGGARPRPGRKRQSA
jgi:transcriptional regulator with XRE-family HTH domain